MSESSNNKSLEGMSSSVDYSSLFCAESLTPYSDVTKLRKPSRHVKRPMNGFILWSHLERRKIIESHPNLHHAEVSKQLGQRWKDLSVIDKQPFFQEAERLKVLHSQEFPNYKFKPKKKKSPTKKQNLDSPPQESSDINLNTEQAKFLKKKKLPQSTESTPQIAEKKKASESNEGKKNASSSQSVAIEGKMDPSLKVLTSNPKFGKTPDNSKSLAGKNKKCKIDPAVIRMWDALREVNVTTLSINKSDSADFYRHSDVDKFLRCNFPNKAPLPFHVDGCLTSGSIAAIACYREDWAETFDYLTDKVLQSSKNICEEINNIDKHYKALLDDDISLSPSPATPTHELEIPDINKVLGKHWKDPNMGSKFLL